MIAQTMRLALTVLLVSGPSVVMAGAEPSQAEEPQEGSAPSALTDLMDMSLEQLLAIKISIASKTEESASDAPSSVTVFSKQEIQTLGVTCLEDLLNFVPGFQATREVEQGTQIRIGVRGKSTALAESILVLVNGQRINDLYSGGVSVLNRHIALGNIERVEIIRGPGSALYGANAFVGAIDVITATGESSVFVQAGNIDSRSIAANLSKKLLDDDLSVTAFVQAFSDDGFRYRGLVDRWGVAGDTVDPRSGYDAQATASYDGLTLRLRHMERRFEDFIAWGNLQPARGNARERTTQSSVKIDYGIAPVKSLNLEFSAGYSQDSWESISISVPYGSELAPGLTLDQAFRTGPYIKSYGASVLGSVGAELHKTNKLVVGATYERSGITTVSNLMDHDPVDLTYLGEVREFDAPDATFNEKETRSIVGLFVQDKQSITDYLSIVAGVRYDWYDDFGSAVSPRVAAIASLPFGAKLRVNYGQAFRAPSFLELYDKNNPIDFGNPELEAEKINTFEAAYIQRIKDRLQVSVTYYYSELSDFIVFGAPVDNVNNPLGAPGFVNSGESRLLRGLEVDFKAQPFDSLLLFGSFSHLFEADDLLMSPNTGSLAASYKVSELTTTASAVFHDAIEILPSQDAYVLLGANVSYRVTQPLELTVNVNNLLDERIRTASSVLKDGAPNRGRIVLLGLHYHL